MVMQQNVTGTASAADASIGRAAVAGAAIGFVVIFTLMAAILLGAGSGLVSAVGVGTFVAAFGGPGWGGMIGAVRCAERSVA
jgi:hypothetical protein